MASVAPIRAKAATKPAIQMIAMICLPAGCGAAPWPWRGRLVTGLRKLDSARPIGVCVRDTNDHRPADQERRGARLRRILIGRAEIDDGDRRRAGCGEIF